MGSEGVSKGTYYSRGMKGRLPSKAPFDYDADSKN